jgi:thioredoxin 1
MKSIFLVGIFALVAFVAARYPFVDFKKDAENGIQFHKETWQKALELAQKENKLVFLDIYATWCGPCKKLKANTFSDATVGAYYNPNFINVALDGEEGEGKILAEKYKVTGYPTLLFIDKDGNIVYQTGGYMSAKNFVKLGEKVLQK